MTKSNLTKAQKSAIAAMNKTELKKLIKQNTQSIASLEVELKRVDDLAAQTMIKDEIKSLQSQSKHAQSILSAKKPTVSHDVVVPETSTVEVVESMPETQKAQDQSRVEIKEGITSSVVDCTVAAGMVVDVSTNLDAEVKHPAEPLRSSEVAKNFLEPSVIVTSVFVPSVGCEFRIGQSVTIKEGTKTVAKKHWGRTYIVTWLGKERLALAIPGLANIDDNGQPVPPWKLNVYPRYTEVNC